jgi:SOS-response transcriptional repressor LexA
MTAFLTKHQRKAMLFIEELERTGGIAPSVREIAFHYRSTSTAILKGSRHATRSRPIF